VQWDLYCKFSPDSDSEIIAVASTEDACLPLFCLFLFFSTKPRDRLGRTSPK